MTHLEPTYLRYIYDGLIKGSIHPENAAELPEGLIGLYEEAFDEKQPVHLRQQLLERFAIWALLKKEVSAQFVAEVLNQPEAEIQEFIAAYSAWFNSPESGKYQLYHERLKVYLLQKLSEGEVHVLHEKLISRLEQAIEEQKADEFEWYGLEFLSVHLTISCYNKRSKKLIDRFTEYALNDSFHNRQIQISNQYEWTFKLLQLAQHSSIVLRKRDVELINVKIIDVNKLLQLSIHDIIQFTREGNYNISLVRINSLTNHSENEVKTKLRLILLILTDLGINRKRKDSFDRSFVSDVIDVFELESRKFNIDVFDLISPNIYFQIVLFLKESSLDYKSLLHAIIFDWGFSGISKIITTDFIEFFLSVNKENYVKLQDLFHEIRNIAYYDNSNKNKSRGNSVHHGAIEAIDCMLISIILKLDSKKLKDFIKNSFKDFLEAFSLEYVNSWINSVMSYVHVDTVIEILYFDLCPDDIQFEDNIDNDKLNIKVRLILLESILLKAHLSKNNSDQITAILEYSENLLNEYLNVTSLKSKIEKKLEFFDLLILINGHNNKNIGLLLNPIIKFLYSESDDISLNQIIRILYFFGYTEHISKLLQLYTNEGLSNRANVLVNDQLINHENVEIFESSYIENLIYKLENDLAKNKLSKSTLFFLENLKSIFSNIASDKSDGYYEQYYWKQCLELIVKNELENYVDLYFNEILKYCPDLTYQVFYHLVKRPNLIKNRLLIKTDIINLINLEIALKGKYEKKQIDKLYKLLLDNEKKTEIQWYFDSSQVYRYAKLKLEKGEIQDAINCISKIEVSSKYFVHLIFDISLKLFQNNEEIDFAIDILQNVKYHFESDDYEHTNSLTVFHSFYHVDAGKGYLSLVDRFLNRVLSYNQIVKDQMLVILKNVGVIDENMNLLTQNYYPFSFIKKIMDKDLRSIIRGLFNWFSFIEKPIQFSINHGIPNILDKELNDSEIHIILNELDEYSNFFSEQDFFPDYNKFFNYIGLTKANLLNPVHSRNIIQIKNAIVDLGISEYQPIYSFCQILISNSKQKDRDSSLKTIFPEFENNSLLSEYLHKIALLNKLERKGSFVDFYHFNYITENTNRDGLIEELFQKQQFHPRKHLFKLVDLDDFVKRNFLVYFFDQISSFYSNEINWELVYFLCGKDYVLLNHFTTERLQMLQMQGRISKKLEKLITDKKDYLSGINDLNNLSLSQE
jgi:hypothetical protein